MSEERLQERAGVVMPPPGPPGPSAFAVLSFLVSAASLTVGIYGLVLHRRTHRRLHGKRG